MPCHTCESPISLCAWFAGNLQRKILSLFLQSCTSTDVTSTDEKPRFSFWAFTAEVIPELYKTRNLETSTERSKRTHSCGHGLPRHCLVYECSLFQNSWGNEFLFTAWALWIQAIVCWDFCLCKKWWLGNWLPPEGIDPSPYDYFVVNYSKSLVPKAQFLFWWSWIYSNYEILRATALSGSKSFFLIYFYHYFIICFIIFSSLVFNVSFYYHYFII